MDIILENKVMLSKNVNNKKCATKFIFFCRFLITKFLLGILLFSSTAGFATLPNGAFLTICSPLVVRYRKLSQNYSLLSLRISLSLDISTV